MIISSDFINLKVVLNENFKFLITVNKNFEIKFLKAMIKDIVLIKFNKKIENFILCDIDGFELISLFNLNFLINDQIIYIKTVNENNEELFDEFKEKFHRNYEIIINSKKDFNFRNKNFKIDEYVLKYHKKNIREVKIKNKENFNKNKEEQIKEVINKNKEEQIKEEIKTENVKKNKIKEELNKSKDEQIKEEIKIENVKKNKKSSIINNEKIKTKTPTILKSIKSEIDEKKEKINFPPFKEDFKGFCVDYKDLTKNNGKIDFSVYKPFKKQNADENIYDLL